MRESNTIPPSSDVDASTDETAELERALATFDAATELALRTVRANERIATALERIVSLLEGKG